MPQFIWNFFCQPYFRSVHACRITKKQESLEWAECLRNALPAATEEHIENLINRLIEQAITVTMLVNAAYTLLLEITMGDR